MKKFEAPVLEVIEDFAMEPVYALSGTPDTPDKPDGDWDITTYWPSHNSGSHSVLAIVANNTGSLSGDCITMEFLCKGFKLSTISNTSGYQASIINDKTFKIYRNGHFNPGERIEFNIELTASDTNYGGAVGKTGEVCPHQVICTSYITS